MDERRAEALLTTLTSLGLVEERDGDVWPTRRWNARLQATAERINLEIARSGVEPAGNGLMVAIAQALLDEKTNLAPDDFDDAVRMLAVLEISRMKPDKRDAMGFGDVVPR